jgi:hypothetical protein
VLLLLLLQWRLQQGTARGGAQFVRVSAAFFDYMSANCDVAVLIGKSGRLCDVRFLLRPTLEGCPNLDAAHTTLPQHHKAKLWP